MPNDPIERLSADVEIFAIPQRPGMPPMTDAVFHVRRRQDGAAAQARLGLPAYEGQPGPPGPPGAVHQGDRTTSQLEALRTALDGRNINWAYRNSQTNDQWVWTGDDFVIYHGVYGTPGPVGPPPQIDAGPLTVGGNQVDPAFGVRVGGSAGVYTVGIDMPPPPPGEKGDPGPSGSIIDSVDVDESSSPADGDGLVYVEGTGKLEWRPASTFVPEYVIPPSGFTSQSVNATTTRINLATLSLPAMPYPYRLDISGDIDVDCRASTQIDIEVRVGASDGPLVALGRTGAADGWRPVYIRSHSDVAITPETMSATTPANVDLVLWIGAVKRAGSTYGWGVRADRAQLRVRLLRVSA
ncbi:hypothetical protein [Gordonia sp. SND2]|uniref:hypothetical protein n=1 Tax=Gordonia sp. SND2 TaxID=3388659 RepID=UPI00398AC7CB